MWYRARVLVAVTVYALFSRLAVASQEKIQEMPISQFLDLVEEQRLSDEQIRAAAKGAALLLPLQRAREQKRAGVVRRLLEACDGYGDTPLLSAVQSNNHELAEKLLDAKADPNGVNCRILVGVDIPSRKTIFHSRFPLAVAALQTKSSITVQLLIDHGAFDPNYNRENVADRLATTVRKCMLYGRNSGQEQTNLKDIESMLLLAARQRLLADTLRCNMAPEEGQQDEEKEAKQGDGPVQESEEPEQHEQSWWKLHCIVS